MTLVAVACAIAVVTGAPAAAAPSPGDDVVVSVATGASRPSNESFRELYGTIHWPLLVQVDVPVHRGLGAFAGLRWVAREGVAADQPPQDLLDPFPIEITITSVRFGGTAAASLSRADVFASVGAEYARGQEEWPTAALAYDLRGWGAVLQGGIRVPVWGRVSLLGLIEYTSLAAGGEPETPRVDLGGFTAGGGFSIRF